MLKGMMFGLGRLADRAIKRHSPAILVMIALAVALVFFALLKMLFILFLLICMNMCIAFLLRQFYPFGTCIEVTMLSTVLAGYAYGAAIGAVVGIVSVTAYYLALGRISVYLLVYAPLYALVGAISSFSTFYPIAALGIVATLAYTLVSSAILLLFLSGKLDRAMIFALINIPLNFMLFRYIAPLILIAMK